MFEQLSHQKNAHNNSKTIGEIPVAEDVNLSSMQTVRGVVKWFDPTKGYGFIAPEDGGKDIFVHISAVERAGIRQLNDGQAVSFEIEAGRDGRQSATNLELA